MTAATTQPAALATVATVTTVTTVTTERKEGRMEGRKASASTAGVYVPLGYGGVLQASSHHGIWEFKQSLQTSWQYQDKCSTNIPTYHFRAGRCSQRLNRRQQRLQASSHCHRLAVTVARTCGDATRQSIAVHTQTHTKPK